MVFGEFTFGLSTWYLPSAVNCLRIQRLGSTAARSSTVSSLANFTQSCRLFLRKTNITMLKPPVFSTRSLGIILTQHPSGSSRRSSAGRGCATLAGPRRPGFSHGLQYWKGRMPKKHQQTHRKKLQEKTLRKPLILP